MISHNVVFLQPDETDLILDPRAAELFNPLARPYLALDLRKASSESATARRLSLRLQHLPCPVLAVGLPTHTLAAAADVVVESPDLLSGTIANIEQAPIASAVLVQTLRATAGLLPDLGLAVESLAYSALQKGADFSRWLARRKAPAIPQREEGPAVIMDRDGPQLSLILNRPKNRNAMSIEMRDGLTEALEFALADTTINLVRVTGAGACFSVGGDLSEFASAPDPATAHAVRQARLPGARLARIAEHAEIIVHGAVIGSGIEFAAFAGKLRATVDAFFQLPEIRYGLIPGAGGCVSIPRRIGRQRTAYLALSARRVSARTALEWGLIDEIVS